jgi:hypothetical protein
MPPTHALSQTNAIAAATTIAVGTASFLHDLAWNLLRTGSPHRRFVPNA